MTARLAAVAAAAAILTLLVTEVVVPGPGPSLMRIVVAATCGVAAGWCGSKLVRR